MRPLSLQDHVIRRRRQGQRGQRIDEARAAKQHSERIRQDFLCPALPYHDPVWRCWGLLLLEMGRDYLCQVGAQMQLLVDQMANLMVNRAEKPDARRMVER